MTTKSFENKFKYVEMTVTDQNSQTKLKADLIQGMLATIQFRIFCLPIFSLTI
jgi:hypothetical protein